MSATEDTTLRYADASLLEAMAGALGACADALSERCPEAATAWAAAALAMGHRSPSSASDPVEAALVLVDAAFDPLAPPWFLVDGLIALIVEHVAIDAPSDQVVAVDRSLDGLRQLGRVLRRRLPSRR
jgi:hypothetical protein